MPLSRKPRISVQDEGTAQGRVGTLNFAGAGVSAAVSGDVATATISGGGAGSVSATVVEVNLGSTPVTRGKFTITDAAIGATSKILIWQSYGPYTGKGTLADEAEMDPIVCFAIPGSGTAVVRWHTEHIVVEGLLATRSAALGGGTAANSGTNRDRQSTAVRLGRVRGNVKFAYIVVS